MMAITAIPSIMVIESGRKLPPRLYAWLDDLGLDVLGTTDDLVDGYRLAGDRRPRLAIVDKRIGVDCRRHLHAVLASLNVASFNLALAAYRRREGLIALQNAMVPLCGFAARPELALSAARERLFCAVGTASRVVRTPRAAHQTA